MSEMRLSCAVCNKDVNPNNSARLHCKFRVLMCRPCMQQSSTAYWVGGIDFESDKMPAICWLCGGTSQKQPSIKFVHCSKGTNCKQTCCASCILRLSKSDAVKRISAAASSGQNHKVSEQGDTFVNVPWNCFTCDAEQFKCPQFTAKDYQKLRSSAKSKRKTSKGLPDGQDADFSTNNGPHVTEKQLSISADLLFSQSVNGKGPCSEKRSSDLLGDMDDSTSRAAMYQLLGTDIMARAIANASAAEAICVAPAQHDRDYRTGRDGPNEHLNVAAPPPYSPPFSSAPAPPVAPPPFTSQPPPPPSSVGYNGPVMTNMNYFGSLSTTSASNDPITRANAQPSVVGRPNPMPNNQPYVAPYSNFFAQQQYSGTTPFPGLVSQYHNTNSAAFGGAHSLNSSRFISLPVVNGMFTNGVANRDGRATTPPTMVVRPDQVSNVARGAIKRCDMFTAKIREYANLNAATVPQTAEFCSLVTEFLRYFSNVEELEQIGRFEAPARATPSPQVAPSAAPTLNPPQNQNAVPTNRNAPGAQQHQQPAATANPLVASVTTASGLSVSVAADDVLLAGTRMDWDREVGSMLFSHLSTIQNSSRLRSFLERYVAASTYRLGNRLSDMALSPRSRREAQQQRERAASAPPTDRQPNGSVATGTVTQPQYSVDNAQPESNAAQPISATSATTSLPQQPSAAGSVNTQAQNTNSQPQKQPAKPARVGTMSKLMSPRRAAALQHNAARATQQSQAVSSSTGKSSAGSSITLKNYCIPKVRPGLKSNSVNTADKPKQSAKEVDARKAGSKPVDSSSQSKGATDKDKEKEKQKEKSQPTGTTSTDGLLKLKIKKPILAPSAVNSSAAPASGMNGQKSTTNAADGGMKSKKTGEKSKLPLSTGPQKFLSSASDSDSDVGLQRIRQSRKRHRISSGSSSSPSSLSDSLSSISKDSRAEEERLKKEREKERAREAERKRRELQENLAKEAAERREREINSDLINQNRRCVERPPGQIRFKKGTFKQNVRCSVGLFDVANIDPLIFSSKTIDIKRWNALCANATYLPPSGGEQMQIAIGGGHAAAGDALPATQTASTIVLPKVSFKTASQQTRNQETNGNANVIGAKTGADATKKRANGRAVEEEDDIDPFREIGRALQPSKRKQAVPQKGFVAAQPLSPSNDGSSAFGTPNGSDVDQLDGKNDKRTPTRRNAKSSNNKEMAALRAELHNGDSDSEPNAAEAENGKSDSEIDFFETSEDDGIKGQLADMPSTSNGNQMSSDLRTPENVLADEDDENDGADDSRMQALRAAMDEDEENSDVEEPVRSSKRVANAKKRVIDDEEDTEEINLEKRADADGDPGVLSETEQANDSAEEGEPHARRTPLNISLGKVPLAPPIGLPKKKGPSQRNRPRTQIDDEVLYNDDVPIEDAESELAEDDSDWSLDVDLSKKLGRSKVRTRSAAKKDPDTKPDSKAHAGKSSQSDGEDAADEVIDLLSDTEQGRLSDSEFGPKKKQKPSKKAAKNRNRFNSDSSGEHADASSAATEDHCDVESLPCSQRSVTMTKKKRGKGSRRIESDSEDIELSGMETMDDDDDEIVLISSDSEHGVAKAKAQAKTRAAAAAAAKPKAKMNIEDSDDQEDPDATTKPKLRRVVLEDDAAVVDGDQPTTNAEEDTTPEKPKRKSKRGANAETTEERKKRLEDLRNARLKKLADSLCKGDDDDGRQDDAETNALLGLYRTSKSDKQKLLTITKEHRIVEQVERERIERIRERQRAYNDVHSANRDAQNRLTRLILEKDTDPPVEVASCLVKRLKEHQAKVIEFMYSNLYVSLEHSRTDKVGSGCIVAHCMGLGKTFSVISFLHTILTRPELYEARTALILAPYNVINNWEDEWHKWFVVGEGEERPPLVNVINLRARGNRGSSLQERVRVMKQWKAHGNVLICSYETFRNLVLPQGGKNGKSKRKQANAKKIPAEITEAIEALLCDPGPDLVVCDEGHIMKNIDSAIAEAVFKIRTRRRIVLTGTPLQNHLKEYHCMVSFCKESLLGPLAFFRYQFVQPITAGQHKDSTEWQVKLMKKRAHVLNQKLKECIDRRDVDELKRFLPMKFEYTIYVRYSRLQTDLYQLYLSKYPPPKQATDVFDEVARRAGNKKLQSTRLFADHRRLMLINAHPYALHLSAVRLAEQRPLDEFIASDTDESEDSEDGDAPRKRKRGANANKASTSRAANGGDSEEEEEAPDDDKVDPRWWREMVTDPASIKYVSDLSGKFVLLLEIIRMCEEIGDKLLVFSQSLVTLDLIEFFLEHTAETARARAAASATNLQMQTDSDAPVSTNKCRWDWEQDYLRIDGTTDADTRKRYIDRFNDPENTRCRLFLISVKAGGLGINLCSSNRIVLFDVSWNPATDAQALFRSYRLGQTKPVYIYRLVSEGTMEHKIYNRCIVKSSLAKRVIDAHQIERYYTQADLQELYRFEADVVDNVELDLSPSWTVPRDRMLGDLLSTQSNWIVRYQEHETLLENRVEEDLTEEERAQAWREFESERRQEKQKSMATRISEACRLAALGLPVDIGSIPEAAPFVFTVRHVRHLLLQQGPAALAYDRVFQMLRTPYENSPPLDEMLARIITNYLTSSLLTNMTSGVGPSQPIVRVTPNLGENALPNNFAAAWNNRAHPDRASLLNDLERQAIDAIASNSGAALPQNRLMMQHMANAAAGRRVGQVPGHGQTIVVHPGGAVRQRVITQNQAAAAAAASHVPLGSNDESTAIEISDDNDDGQLSPDAASDVVALSNGGETVPV